MSTSARPWFPQRDYRSWNVVRRCEKPTTAFDREFYITPGKQRPRRFVDCAAAQAFADALNEANTVALAETLNQDVQS
jgi:hypothetical protein